LEKLNFFPLSNREGKDISFQGTDLPVARIENSKTQKSLLRKILLGAIPCFK
jgi:hypothetical protein